MKKLFYFGLLGLLLFEILNVYFIMPIPGSQRMDSIDVAYFLYKLRWIFRGVFGAMILVGLASADWKRKWVPVIPMLFVAGVVYMTNFKMAADHMFYQPGKVLMLAASENKVDSNRLVIGVTNNGQSKAYPIRFIGYHHQVQDTVGGKPLIITYCTVCRTGRVFEPVVNGKQEKFRLVGMDHFNAMFEDATTKSWWRQVNGEAITGKLKGQQLPEFFSTQTSLAEWLRLNPQSLVMQADPAYTKFYDTSMKYESGKSRNSLTGTDSLSWRDKSWVVGVKAGKERKAYDWNQLKSKRIILDTIGNTAVAVLVSQDNSSFFAFERADVGDQLTLQQDTIIFNEKRFRLDGKGIGTPYSLKPLPAYQEFWHSWKTFNPSTRKYQ